MKGNWAARRRWPRRADTHLGYLGPHFVAVRDKGHFVELPPSRRSLERAASEPEASAKTSPSLTLQARPRRIPHRWQLPSRLPSRGCNPPLWIIESPILAIGALPGAPRRKWPDGRTVPSRSLLKEPMEPEHSWDSSSPLRMRGHVVRLRRILRKSRYWNRAPGVNGNARPREVPSGLLAAVGLSAARRLDSQIGKPGISFS